MAPTDMPLSTFIDVGVGGLRGDEVRREQVLETVPEDTPRRSR